MGSRHTRELLRDVLHASKMPKLSNLLIFHFSISLQKIVTFILQFITITLFAIKFILLQSNLKYFH